MFWPDGVSDEALGRNSLIPERPGYPFHHQQQIANLLAQTWSWIERHGLIARASGYNGNNGWMIFTPDGQAVADGQDFQRLREAAAFPKTLIHPLIREKVWRALMRNDLDEAVFASFKAVEEEVRRAGGFAPTDIGVPLMRKAFDKSTGPLTDMSQPEPERDALAHLFAGAIGSYKNPQSHRTVNLTDPAEARERVVLASHLLRIVESRRKN